MGYPRSFFCPEVVPLAGTWIETPRIRYAPAQLSVVPLAGTWIETAFLPYNGIASIVVPLAGTWIETCKWRYKRH